MNNMGVVAALAVLVLFIATVKAGNGRVTFWMEDFTMTCPENGTWFDKDKKQLQGKESETYKLKYDNDKKGPYYCVYGGEGTETTTYYFYVKGKVCKNCFELDAYVLGLAIIVDVVGTAFVMMMIFRWTKKKSSAGLTHASKAPARSGGRAPPVPSPDYEQLNAHTRSQDTYSIVNSKTG